MPHGIYPVVDPTHTISNDHDQLDVKTETYKNIHRGVQSKNIHRGVQSKSPDRSGYWTVQSYATGRPFWVLDCAKLRYQQRQCL
jgi:hypothetical protein